MNNTEIEKLVDAIKDRASLMYIAGNPPNPQWWLERMKELVMHVLIQANK
jgi:hypothetical protein